MKSSKQHRNWNGLPVTSYSERTCCEDDAFKADATDSRTSHPDGLRHHYLFIPNPYRGKTYSSGHPSFAISASMTNSGGCSPGGEGVRIQARPMRSIT